MTLSEVACVTDTSLEQSTTLEGNSYASFKGLEIENGSVRRYPVGFGATPKEAREALAIKLSYKLVVTGDFSEHKNSFHLTVTV